MISFQMMFLSLSDSRGTLIDIISDDIVAPEVLIPALSELGNEPRIKTVVFFEISSAQSKTTEGEKYVVTFF